MNLPLLLQRRGIENADDDVTDPLAEASLALAALASASVQGRIATGPRAGRRVLQLGREPDVPWASSRGPRQARLDGFDLHADVSVPPAIGGGSSNCAATYSGPRSRRSASASCPTDGSSSR